MPEIAILRILSTALRTSGARWRSELDAIMWSSRLHVRVLRATADTTVPFSIEVQALIRETIRDLLIDALAAGAIVRATVPSRQRRRDQAG